MSAGWNVCGVKCPWCEMSSKWNGLTPEITSHLKVKWSKGEKSSRLFISISQPFFPKLISDMINRRESQLLPFTKSYSLRKLRTLNDQFTGFDCYSKNSRCRSSITVCQSTFIKLSKDLWCSFALGKTEALKQETAVYGAKTDAFLRKNDRTE